MRSVCSEASQLLPVRPSTPGFAANRIATERHRNLMIQLLVRWIISAVLLLVVSQVVPGFHVIGLRSAMIAALVIGLVNATVGVVLKIVTFPLTIVTLGLFLLIINAFMLMFASHFVSGFVVDGFVPAFWGALLLSILGMVTRWLTPTGN
jgi:putative membrane protein